MLFCNNGLKNRLECNLNWLDQTNHYKLKNINAMTLVKVTTHCQDRSTE